MERTCREGAHEVQFVESFQIRKLVRLVPNICTAIRDISIFISLLWRHCLPDVNTRMSIRLILVRRTHELHGPHCAPHPDGHVFPEG